MRALLWGGWLAAGLAFAPAAYGETGKWEEIFEEDGITVWQRKIEGQSLVEFRGRGVIPSSYKQILAVLADHKRKLEWMESCVGNRKVRDYGPGRVVMYNRTGSTVPLVSDRDVVMESNVDIWADRRQITIDIWNVDDPSAPEVDGVVRMPEIKASWVLRALGPDRTEVTYNVRADPGGAIPHWVVNMVAKKIPFKTLRNLRNQAKKPGYDEQLAFVEASFDWSGFKFDAPAPPAEVKPLGTDAVQAVRD